MKLTVIENCNGCGACCREQESPPGYMAILLQRFEHDHDDPDVIRARSLPLELKRELMEYADLLIAGKPHPNGGVCLWFDEDTHKCRHYGMRPSICRTGVEVGDAGCRKWRDVYADTLIE